MSGSWRRRKAMCVVVLAGILLLSSSVAVADITLDRQYSSTQSGSEAMSSDDRLQRPATTELNHPVDGWTMARANAANTNHINTTGPTNPITTRWTFATEANSFGTGPLVANDTVYFGTKNYRLNRGKLYAVDAWTGEVRWTFQAPSENYPNKIAIFRNTVYVGTYNGKVYALDAATGDTFWSFATAGRPTGLTVVNRTLYVTSKGAGSFPEEGHVYALGALRGDEKWVFDTKGPALGPPAVKAGTVYVSARHGDLYALDAETGTVKWNVGNGPDYPPPPVVANGIVYGKGTSGLRAMEAETGDVIWTRPGGPIPSILGNTAYFTANKSLHAVNAKTGTDRWSSSSLRRIPLFTNDIGYVRMDKTLYTLNPATGAHTARWRPDQINNSWDRFRVGMAVLNGSLYTGVGYDDPGNRHRSDRTVFYALGTPKFAYSNLSVKPPSPTNNASVTITAAVRNTGTGPGSYNATLAVNGADVADRTGRLEAGTRTHISFDLKFPNNGTYTLKVGGLTRTITVGDVAPNTTETTTLTPVPETVTHQTETLTPQTGTTQTPTETTGPGFGASVLIVAVAVLGGLVVLRTRY